MLSAGARVAESEAWDAIFLGGVKVGHIHTYIEPVKDRGRELLRVRVDMKLTLKRQKDAVTMQLVYGTIETPEGSVLKLDALVPGQASRISAPTAT